MALSNSGMALHRLLEEQSPAATAVQARFHRTVLWRWRTGKAKPSIETAALLEQLSGGRVPANGWRDLAAEADADAAPASDRVATVPPDEAEGAA